MREITAVGMDLAKNVFHVVCRDRHDKEVKKRMLKRGQVLAYFANLPKCLVGLEACAGAHDWARKLREHGHEIKLIPPQYVKPYVRGNKNDYNDARAIGEAVRRPDMRFVAVKTVAQQDIQALHRMRERSLEERTGLCNQIRGLLTEYGIVVPKGVEVLRRRLPELLEDGENALSDFFRPLLARCYQQLQEIDEHIEFYTREVELHAKQDEAEARLQTAPGFGPIVASVFHSVIGDGKAFAKGRDVSASLGLVPRQHSSGGKEVLLGISKRGNSYLRSLLVHGARAVVSHAHKKDDRLSRWIMRIKDRRGFNKAVVALANKMARIGWAILHHNTVYNPKHTCRAVG
ncbi:MAG: IS110 family transposase [Shimia sp.]|nr:IS110 family transposase [Shimia sp.]